MIELWHSILPYLQLITLCYFCLLVGKTSKWSESIYNPPPYLTDSTELMILVAYIFGGATIGIFSELLPIHAIVLSHSPALLFMLQCSVLLGVIIVTITANTSDKTFLVVLSVIAITTLLGAYQDVISITYSYLVQLSAV